MPYINSDGSIRAAEGWTLRRVLLFPLTVFWGVVTLVSAFFSSLVGSRPQKSISGGVIRRPAARPLGGGGGDGGKPGGGGAPPPPTPRPTASNVRGMGSLRPDPCATGGG
jgi:hypothetical protein